MRRIRTPPILTLILSLMAFPALCQDRKQVTRELRREYKDKVFLLRNSYSGGTLHYSPAGELLDGGPPGPWTLTGHVRVNKVSVEKDKLEIRARRLLLLFDDRKQEFHEHGTWQTVKIEVAGSEALNTASWKETVERIFVRAEAEWQATLPTYWKRFFERRGGGSKGGDVLRKSQAPQSAGEPDEHGVYQIGGPVSAPKCVFCQDAGYNDVARANRLTGKVTILAVITEQGRITDPQIVKPFGAGLDEAAVEAILRWQFEPARRAGVAVPVHLTVETDFSLY